MPKEIAILNDIIRTRRSIFPQNFTTQKIDDNIISEILENANWAPTHGLTQPWRFTIFCGEGLKKLADFQSEWYKNNTPPEKFLAAKYEKMQTNPLLSSHVISIGAALGTRENIPDIEEYEAVACAVQNMSLTAHSYGLGAYWGSGGVTYEKSVNSFFGLEEKDLLLGFLFLGYPKSEGMGGIRTPIENKIRWVR